MRFTTRSLALSAMVFICAMSLSAAEHTKDSLDTVKMNLEGKKAVLIDVRETEEWDRGHLSQATHVPLSRIQKGMTAAEWEKIVPKDSIIYLHCAAGGRCLKASELLPKTMNELRALKPGYRELLGAGFSKADK